MRQKLLGTLGSSNKRPQSIASILKVGCSPVTSLGLPSHSLLKYEQNGTIANEHDVYDVLFKSENVLLKYRFQLTLIVWIAISFYAFQL